MKIFFRNFNYLKDFSKSRKLLILIFLNFNLLSYQSFANSKVELSLKFNFSMKDVTIGHVLDYVESKSNYYFFLKQDNLLDKKVTVNYKDATVKDVLNKLLNETSYTYIIVDHYITIVPKTNKQPSEFTIKGIVKDEQGSPIPGVSVSVKGSTNGTITDPDGKFVLNIRNENVILKFSFIGMSDLETNADINNNMEIVMKSSVIDINEVVVTALGIKRDEKALGYAIQKIDGEELNTVKGIDIQTSLTGKVAGLLVNNTTEFAQESSIKIRGEEPLLVIDGVPYGDMSLRDIPSDDIKDINVLKGATASALYGYKGASGVIMITTKKDSRNKGFDVSINSGTMVNAGFLAIPKVQSTFGREITTSTNTINRYSTGSWGVPFEGQSIIQWDPESKSLKEMAYLARGKDNFKNYLEQGFILNNNVSLAYQGEKGSLRSSFTWVKNNGQYPNSILNKYTYSLSGNVKLGDFTLSSSMMFNKQKSPNIGFNGYTSYDPMYSLLIWSTTDWDVRQYKNYWLVTNESQNNSYLSTNNNPYFDRYERIHSLDKDVLNGFISMDYNILPWLETTWRTGFDTYSNHQEVRISQGSYVSAGNATVLDEGGSTIWGESQKGSFNTGLGRKYSINSDFIVEINHKFNRFNIDGFVGSTIFYNQYEGIESMTQGGLSIPGFYSLDSSEDAVETNSVLERKQVNSLYGRLAASWKDMIFIDGTLRNDWSSTLPASTRSYLYPSLSLSYVISEMLPKSNWLDFLKVSGSWAKSKTPAGIYEINNAYSITTSAWASLNSASYPDVIRGSEVSPESSTSFEVGANMKVLRKLASLDVSYYQKKMYDFLEEASISTASGFSSNYINTDEIETRKGVEIVLNVNPIRKNNWNWDFSLNWSTYAQYYTKIDPDYSEDYPWIAEGKRTDHYVSYDFLKDSQGNIIYSNGLPKYSSYYSLFGYSDPDWIWGANSRLKYKNLSLSVSLDGRVGGLCQSSTEIYLWRTGNHPNSITDERFQDAVDTETGHYIGDGVKVVSGEATYDSYGNITSDTREYATNDVAVKYSNYINQIHTGTAWGGNPSPGDILDNTFLKLREVSLTYNFSASICDKIAAKNASLSFVGQNVFLWARDFKYSDPDAGKDDFSDPSIRYLGMNIKLTF